MDLLHGALDYAGLFPPAGLGMADAARRYARYRSGAERRLLGAFVVPVARLDELRAAARDARGADGKSAWPLSVLSGGDPREDRARMAELAAGTGFTVRSVERKVETPDEARAVAEALRGGGGASWALYLEIAPDRADGMIEVVGAAGAYAKLRTGATTPDDFPSTDAVARFLLACARARVPLKATAGLHHAVRGEHPVTYEPGSPRATMHGFLNLFTAAALLDAGAIGEQELAAVLEERSAAAFRVGNEGNGGVHWRDRAAREGEVRRARARLLHSFGTCSFEEPVAELRALGAL